MRNLISTTFCSRFFVVAKLNFYVFYFVPQVMPKVYRWTSSLGQSEVWNSLHEYARIISHTCTLWALNTYSCSGTPG